MGALVRTGKPLGGLKVRKMVLAGTSMSAGTLINYLPAHRVFRTPEMQHVYDGFYPTSNGSLIPDVDVPVVHLPTMLEVAAANITDRATATSRASSIGCTRWPAWLTSTRATACG